MRTVVRRLPGRTPPTYRLSPNATERRNMLNALAANDVMAALSVLPEETWDTHDDKCDCMYPRIGFWTNPYLAETLEVRMCCIWKELYQLFPGHVRNTAAFYDYNRDEWVKDPMEWNADYDMPKAMWYRQMARKEGISVSEAREMYADLDYLRPKGIPRPPEPEQEPQPSMADVFMELLGQLALKVQELEDRIDSSIRPDNGVRPPGREVLAFEGDEPDAPAGEGELPSQDSGVVGSAEWSDLGVVA